MMLIRFLGSGMLAAIASSIGILTVEKFETRIAGGKAISSRALMARHTMMAAVMRQMKEHKAKQG